MKHEFKQGREAKRAPETPEFNGAMSAVRALRPSVRTRIVVAAAFAVVAAVFAADVPAAAAASTLYVNGASPTCSDSGTGTSSVPYCSITKANQSLTTAGQTVSVVGGTYTGSSISPPLSGTSTSPITFTASAGVTITGGAGAFAISSRSYIVINGFTISGTTSSAISVSSSDHITLSYNHISGSGQRVKGQTAPGISINATTASLVTHNTSDNNSDHGIIFQGGSFNNTASFNEASLNAEGWQRNANGINVIDTGSTGNTLLGNIVHDNEDSGLQFFSGANNGLAINNVSYNNGDHGIDDYNVTGGRLIDNTIYHNCTDGINVEGTSGNYLVANNISVDNAVYPAYKGISCSRRTGDIGIYDSAPATTTVDYNFVYLTTAGNLYVWNNNVYSSPAAMFAATGQEQHGIQADPKWVSTTAPNFHLLEGSKAIDSANSGASGESSIDADGNPRVDDPSTANTGAGPRTYDDRGAYELQTIDTQAPTVPTGLAATAPAPTQVVLTWNASSDNVGVAGYTVYRNGAQLAVVNSPGYTDASVSASTTYTYKVDAFDAANNHSAQSTGVSVTTPAPDTTPPSVPTGLSAPGVSASSVQLTWNASADNVGVAGYTVYRNGVVAGTTPSTTYTDSGLSPSTTYTYRVDAFDASGNHSAQSAPVGVTTTAKPISYVQSVTYSTGGRFTSTTMTLKSAVAAGDLLTGLFAEFDAAGQVSVSDSVNGAWTRAGGITYTSGKGDIALYYVANSKGAPAGLTVTISASASTYLSGTVSEYSGVAADAPLDKMAVHSGSGTAVDSGSTASVPAGELVYAAMTANSSPGTVTGGSSQGVSFTMRSSYGDSAEADILSDNAGAQDARFTTTKSVTWYALAAVFIPALSTSDTVPPSTPTGLTATNANPNVNLAWNASSDNVGVAGYTIYRNGSTLATVSASTLTYTDTTIASATTYGYMVDAYDAAGNHSPQSAQVSITTSDWVAPTVPGSLTATAPSATQVSLTWAASTDNVGVAGYTVYRNGSAITTVGGTTPSYSDGSVQPSTSYTYAVDAFDAAGNHSGQSAAVGVTTPAPPDTTPPSTPSGLSAVAVTATQVNVAWNASADNVGVTGYTVYRNGSAMTTVGGSTLSYSDFSVQPSTSYTYTVDAFDAAGNHSAQSTAVVVTTPSPDTTPPSTPGGLSGQATSATQVNLTWNASTDDVSVAGYTVYRNGSALGAVGSSTLSYTDSTAAPSTTYTYTVDAFDAAGNHSAQSAAASVTTPVPPDTTPPSVPGGLSGLAASPTQVNLSWSASTDNVGVSGYTVYRNGTALVTVSGSTLSYSDGSAQASTTYAYTVDAFDAAGNHSAQSAASSVTTPAPPDTTPPSVPSGLSSQAVSANQVNLSWSAATDNVGVTGYTVYRNGSALTTVSGSTLSYSDGSAQASTTYSYTVDAFDAAGNHSAQSSAASATTPGAGDSTPPSVPGGVGATAWGPTQVVVNWNASTDNVGVAGYTVYRNGSVLISVAVPNTAYTDSSVSPGNNYSYAVDAYDAAGNHSAQSAPAAVHVPALIRFVQAKTFTGGGRVTSTTTTLGAVAMGDLLVGWFGQYDSSGQIQVSDNVNGAWTRAPASLTWSGSSGDIALFYVANAAAAPSGLTITVTVSGIATYIQGAAAEYSGVATANPLDQVSVAKGSGTGADSGLTAATGGGELVFGGLTTTNGPGTLTPGSSAGVSFVKRSQTSSGSEAMEDIVTSAPGQQHAGFGLTTSTPWFMVAAVFKAA